MTSPHLSGYEPDAWTSPWLLRRAELSPSATALELEDETLSYRELARATRARARALQASGVRDGDVVAVLLPSGLAFVEMVHAASALGITLLLLNTRQTASEIAFQLSDCGARFLVHGAGELREKAVEASSSLGELHRIDLEADAPISHRAAPGSEKLSPLHSQIDLVHPIVILYTSGTTGKPKGVPLSLANFLASAAGAAALLGAAVQERWLLCLPLFHVGGLSILLRGVLAGTTVVLHDRFDPLAVSDALDVRSISGVSLVANMLQRVLEARAGRPAPASLKCVLLGGGPAARSLLSRARTSGFPLAPTDGLTEAASQVATSPPGMGEEGGNDGSIPLPGAELRIVGPEGETLRSGEEGEVCVRGAMVMRGYWKRDPEARDALREGWLFTGDIGSLTPDGRLRVFDRRSDLIVSGGENVYPAEIETALLELTGVAEAGVAGVLDDRFGSRPVAWLVGQPGATVNLAELRVGCEERLAAYKIPIRFHIVDALPRNATGKLMRGKLREP